MSKIPEKYRAPLKSKDKIIEFLKSNKFTEARYYDNYGYLFCFNVKFHNADFSFENLLKFAELPNEVKNDASWQKNAKKVFEKHFNEDNVYTTVIEDMRDSVFDQDTYKMIWNGEKTLDVDFEFQGRSGGWLCLTEFEGLKFKCHSEQDIPVWKDVLYTKLKLLYRFLVQCGADFSPYAVNKELHYQAAFQMMVLFEEHIIQTQAEEDTCHIAAGI